MFDNKVLGEVRSFGEPGTMPETQEDRDVDRTMNSYC